MPPSRRQVLRISVLGTGITLSGCTSGSNVVYPSTEAADEESDRTDSSEIDQRSESSAESDTETRNPQQSTAEHRRLADETDRIFEELRWFETRYSNAVSTYQQALKDATADVQYLRGEINPANSYEANLDEIQQIEDSVSEILEGVTADFEPHYTDHAGIANATRSYFRRATLFTDRRDYVRVDEELRQLADYYHSRALPESIEDRYPSDPIANRLYDWVMVNQELRPLLFSFQYTPDGFGAYVANDGALNIVGEPVDVHAKSRIDELFAPFDAPELRRRTVYTEIQPIEALTPVDNGLERSDTETIALKIQQFPDSDDAETAYSDILSDKWVEDEERWAPEPWHQVYYRRDGRTIYAYSIRAGRYIFSLAPSRTPWEERDDWNRLLEGTWIHPLTE